MLQGVEENDKEIMKKMSVFLPGELMAEIFHKLSIRTLVCCTCVCKYWKSIIIDPTFISSHCKLTTTVSPFALCRLYYDDPRYEHEEGTKECFYVYHDNQDFNIYKVINFPFKGHKRCFHVVDSINGLVCLADNYELLYILWNPSIKKHLTLPKPLLTFDEREAYIGFGYDSHSDDYKLVRMINRVDQVDVFSLNSRSWKSVASKICLHYYEICFYRPQVFVNGIVHWIAYRRNGSHRWCDVLLGFNVRDESFLEIMLHNEMPSTNLKLPPFPLAYDETTIALYYKDYTISCLWVMKEYGVVSSWTKVFSAKPKQPIQFGIPLWIRRKGEELLLESYAGRIMAVNLLSGQFRYRSVMGTSGYTFIGPYEESLVLINT